MARKTYVNIKILTERGTLIDTKARVPTAEMLKDAEAVAHFLTWGERVDFKDRPDLKPATSKPAKATKTKTKRQ